MDPLIINLGYGFAGFIVGALAMAALVIHRLGWRLDIKKWIMHSDYGDGNVITEHYLWVGKDTYKKVR